MEAFSAHIHVEPDECIDLVSFSAEQYSIFSIELYYVAHALSD